VKRKIGLKFGSRNRPSFRRVWRKLQKLKSRVTRWVCEKSTQNVSQSIFIKINTFFVDKSSPNIWFYIVILNKLLKVNNCPLGENSPNQVTRLKLKDFSYIKKCMYISRDDEGGMKIMIRGKSLLKVSIY
jgi:IS1 family transposase